MRDTKEWTVRENKRRREGEQSKKEREAVVKGGASLALGLSSTQQLVPRVLWPWPPQFRPSCQ